MDFTTRGDFFNSCSCIIFYTDRQRAFFLKHLRFFVDKLLSIILKYYDYLKYYVALLINGYILGILEWDHKLLEDLSDF